MGGSFSSLTFSVLFALCSDATSLGSLQQAQFSDERFGKRLFFLTGLINSSIEGKLLAMLSRTIFSPCVAALTAPHCWPVEMHDPDRLLVSQTIFTFPS
mmetsp:Transcript_3423/g.4594  ORF Transcript_3423/g.4594 Transcript_3423/m.4594 type:complete len:99 (-) Transcript_3423:252-548(-)